MPETVLLSYGKFLSEDLNEKVKRFRRWEDAQNSLISKMLLVAGLQLYGIEAPAIWKSMQYGEANKPFSDSIIDFNLSHSGTMNVITLSDNGPVGIDIEIVKDNDHDTFREYFNEHEWSTIQESPDSSRRFLELWTQREAIIKADGRGLSAIKRIIMKDNCTAVLDGKVWYLTKPMFAHQFVIHIATSKPIENLRIFIFDPITNRLILTSDETR